MDAADELRAALERRNMQDQAKEQKREELDGLREGFERDEASVKQQLHEAVDLAVQALVNVQVSPANVPITPPPASKGLGRLFERQQFAYGWRIRWGGWDRVLCPDGTLITPRLRIGGAGPTTSTLSTLMHGWIDGHISRVRRGSTGGTETETDFFSQAFGDASYQGQERQVQEIHQRLVAAKASFMQDIADLLRQLGISTV